MFESFPYLFIIPKETGVKSYEFIPDHIHVYMSLVFKQKLQDVSGPVYVLSVNSYCIAGKLLFHRRKKASHSELYYFFNADQSPEYFEVFP